MVMSSCRHAPATVGGQMQLGASGVVPTAILKGAAAGAAGTTALNATTYLDMVLRGRPASSTPEATVEKVSDVTGVDVPGDREARQGRVSGLGALTGIGAGVGVGALLGGLRAAGLRPGPVTGPLLAGTLAMVAGNAPMAGLGVSNPGHQNQGQ